ncbi:glycosyltransferase [Oryzifoliimicrobium ureilyticus]|uniref:glycosyltransferase n=1 Tax=Oryzifoliimicrobium ureilyticus TaxID=3113724 RepID=UPI003076570C
MGDTFVVNGRFLGHGITGVQRYARNVLAAMDQSERSSGGLILTPAGVQVPDYKQLRIGQGSVLRGHAWEQLELPLRAGRGPILNLCNTAAVTKSEQIVCIHDTNVFAAPHSYSRSFRMLYHTLQPLLARRSARIATVSYAAARQISHHLPVALENIAVLPNGHEHALAWDASRATVARDIPGLRDRPFVLVLGSRARHKNMALLVGVAAELDALGINIVIAGGGDGIYAAQTLQERSNILLCGRVSDDDLAYLLDHALCLAFPSLAEGFGLPIVEAMARGCPVISSDCASMPEVCGDAALLASPFRPHEWVDKIADLLGSRQLRDDLVGRGFENVRRFSWSQTAEGYLDLLQNPSVALRVYNPLPPPKARVAAVFATRGRPDIVTAAVRHFMNTQSLQPTSVIVSCPDLADAGKLVSEPGVKVVTGPAGLASQRNTALSHLDAGTDIVAFFDDDFVADANWLEEVAAVFRDEAEIVGVTGEVLADGIKGPGIAFEDAVQLVAQAPKPQDKWIEPYSPYGCNMAFRMSAIGDLRFDERLVLYGWLEDRDFAAALVRKGGRLIKWSRAYGVHMGVKSGRVSGERLGYSQIINPFYMKRKGTMSLANVADHIFRNTVSNFVGIFKSEPFIDRRGRARGNLIAMGDLLRGRLQPERAAALNVDKAIHKSNRRQEAR